VSELIVVFAACALGLLVAVPQASALYGRTSGQREIDRLLGAMERAGADFLWQEMRLLGLLLGLTALGVSLPALFWQNGAYAVGSRSPIAHGGILGLLLAIATLLGPSALYLGESCFSATTESVGRIVGLRRGRFEPSARARCEEFGQLGPLVRRGGHTQSVLGGSAAALLTAVMLPSIRLASPLDGAIGMGRPIVIGGGLTGAASLLFHLGSALQISGRAVHMVGGDVGERLECETVERTESALLPSYRQSIQLAAPAATRSLLRSSAPGAARPSPVRGGFTPHLRWRQRAARCKRSDGVCLDRRSHRLFRSTRGGRCGTRPARFTAESAFERSRTSPRSEIRPGVHGTEHRLFCIDRSEGGGDRFTGDRAALVLKTLENL
jgi:hypothetical protein